MKKISQYTEHLRPWQTITSSRSIILITSPQELRVLDPNKLSFKGPDMSTEECHNPTEQMANFETSWKSDIRDRMSTWKGRPEKKMRK